MTQPNFLKPVLLFDAASCVGMGALLVAATASLSELFGIEPTVLLSAGSIMLAFGLFVGWVATRQPIPRSPVLLIVGLNVAHVVASFLLLSYTPDATLLGTVFVTAQALAVAVLAGLEAIGVSRLTAARG